MQRLRSKSVATSILMSMLSIPTGSRYPFMLVPVFLPGTLGNKGNENHEKMQIFVEFFSVNTEIDTVGFYSTVV